MRVSKGAIPLNEEREPLMPDTDYDEEVDDRFSDPKHERDMEIPCSWCKAAWVGDEMIHLDDCTFARDHDNG